MGRRRREGKACELFRLQQLVESGKSFTSELIAGVDVLAIRFTSRLIHLLHRFARGNVPSLNHLQVAGRVTMDGAESWRWLRARFKGIQCFLRIGEESVSSFDAVA